MLVALAVKSSSSPRRRAGRALQVVTAVTAAVLPAIAGASPWEPRPEIQLPDDGRTAQKVELVDINADGWVDIVFANSKGEGVSGSNANAEVNQVLVNDQGTGFTELGGIFTDPDNAWVIKAGDIDADGDADLVVGVSFSSPSFVLINDEGTFTREDLVDSASASIGDLELGDVDNDGDLDIFASDWGDAAQHGFIDDPGGPLRLWLNNGDGTFANGDAQLMMGMELLAAWSFDVELVDINNDYALDAMISTRGDADPARVLLNDGQGNFSNHPVPALQPMNTKNINVAFTPMDFDGDGAVDVITLQDGGLSQCMGDPPVCARRNSLLLNDGSGGFTIPMAYWGPGDNPGRNDFDAASLDFNNDAKPDFVITGTSINNTVNSRLLLNDGAKFTVAPAPLDSAFPAVAQLNDTVGLMFADFDHDRREDVAVAQRDAALSNHALFGRDDPDDGIAEDDTPPRIYDDNIGSKLGTLLFFGQHAGFEARVNDYKTPSHWHDYLFDATLTGLKLTGDGAALTTHGRRLPYMEFALGLGDPQELVTMADDDPKKFIAPSIWFGEALWRVGFTVPYNGSKTDTLTWQYCAIDAAANRVCVGPFTVELGIDPESCGDGTVQEWETCDDDSPLCVMCENTCGDGMCEMPAENSTNCPEDCGPCDGVCGTADDPMCPDDCPDTDSDSGAVCGDGTCDDGEVCPEDCGETAGECNGVCEPTGGETCPEDCLCGDGVCGPGEDATLCPEDCPGETATDSDGQCPDGGAPGADGQCQLDDDGCGCVADGQGTRGLWGSLLLLGVFGVRRSRKRA
ncbi:FG-GAP-like repeat-containing protein [Nannocystis punicea]|uniref:FG-GAP-like repeat-containing protein n=1 Tax=Nannocystis punicea TaxID=2995304 RepID=A0ABY7GZK3_9BACT|nr:FG-GAP-like repeat-containing protein [Nannocystis poenicansa]WAS92300.1 FG-GAP-like repeat-containing protein [Nannocystis poenicansa]